MPMGVFDPPKRPPISPDSAEPYGFSIRLYQSQLSATFVAYALCKAPLEAKSYAQADFFSLRALDEAFMAKDPARRGQGSTRRFLAWSGWSLGQVRGLSRCRCGPDRDWAAVRPWVS